MLGLIRLEFLSFWIALVPAGVSCRLCCLLQVVCSLTHRNTEFLPHLLLSHPIPHLPLSSLSSLFSLKSISKTCKICRRNLKFRWWVPLSILPDAEIKVKSILGAWHRWPPRPAGRGPGAARPAVVPLTFAPAAGTYISPSCTSFDDCTSRLSRIVVHKMMCVWNFSQCVWNFSASTIV
jgi:hypothetical protein